MSNLMALILATAVLVAIPGPNVALTVANSLSYGFRAGAVTVAGAVFGVGAQLALVVLGLSAVLEVAGSALIWVRWLGVLYLVLLGIRTWRQPAHDLADIAPRRRLFGQAALIAVSNPKTLVFNAAFLPQFVPVDASSAELVVAAAVMLAVIFVGDMAWAACASRARALLLRFSAWRNRITGAFLVAAGAGLALARQQA